MAAAVSAASLSKPSKRSAAPMKRDVSQLTTASERPPTSPRKANESMLSNYAHHHNQSIQSMASDADSIFQRPTALSRTASIYSLSRVAFSNQISQLTSIPLPNPSSLSNSIRSISTAVAAARALEDAAGQIQQWIKKAIDVLQGLDAGDDADWAAAAGREGIAEVGKAVQRFESLVKIYVALVEELQLRSDASSVGNSDMQRIVTQIENINQDWSGIKGTIKSVKQQVELAMEWEELQNTVLGDIGTELEDLARALFELEEKRHKTSDQSEHDPTLNVELADLESIVQAQPPQSSDLITKAASELSGKNYLKQTGDEPTLPEDSNLLGLFARMEPLRTSLEFLPMRLAGFQLRAQDVFPTACEDIDNRRNALQDYFERLETDAQSLRRELGEDRWIAVFRNAGSQALKMVDSVGQSITKLEESLDSNTSLGHANSTAKKVGNYQSKKLHYCPAIERVMGIVDQGMNLKLTVNGEIVRLQADLRQKWRILRNSMFNMDSILEQYDANSQASQQLRDSLSTILSYDRSATSSGLITPGSSPSSSMDIPSRKGSHHEPATPKTVGSEAHAMPNTNYLTPRTQEGKRYSSLPTPITNSGQHQKDTPKMFRNTTPSSTSRHLNNTPTPARLRAQQADASKDNRPRWSVSTRVEPNYLKPLSSSTPSPYGWRKPGASAHASPRGTPPTAKSSPITIPAHTRETARPLTIRTRTSSANLSSRPSKDPRFRKLSTSPHSFAQAFPLATRKSHGALDGRLSSTDTPERIGRSMGADVKSSPNTPIPRMERRKSLLPLPTFRLGPSLAGQAEDHSPVSLVLSDGSVLH